MMASFQYGGINAAEALRLSERGVDRSVVVADVKRCRDRYASASKTAAMLNIGESSVCGVVAGTSAISDTLLDGLYGPTGKALLARHGGAAAVLAELAMPTAAQMQAVTAIGTIARLLPDWIARASSRVEGLADSLADAIAEGDALGRAMVGDQIIEAEPALQPAPATPGWLELALRALDQRHQHLCKVEADAARLINRARDERTKVENARNLLLDMAEDIDLGDDDESAVAAAGIAASEQRMAA